MIAAVILAQFVYPISVNPISVIALGSCADEDKPAPIYDRVVDQKPDAVIFMGDNIYADEPEDKSVAYAKLAAKPGFQRIRSQVPYVLATWDDHDFGINDGGEEYENKAAAQKLFVDFWRDPADSPRRQRPGVYDSYLFGPVGKRTQVILLDTRSFRSPLNRQKNVDGSYNAFIPTTKGTMLGDAQWGWLADQLKQPADLRVIVSSIQVVPEDHMFEKWSNLPLERARLFGLIKSTGAKGVVFASGDRHLAELSMMDGGAVYPIYDLTASAWTNSTLKWRPLEANRWRVQTMNVGNNFGLLRTDWTKRTLTFEIRDEAGDVTIRNQISLDLLQPKAS
jgi:alkaline phosphatase D